MASPQFGEMRGATVPESVRIPESVHGGDVEAGSENMGAVFRPRRRGIIGRKAYGGHAQVARNYNVAGGVQFNNVEEVFQDSVSPEYAQEILEATYEEWGVPFDQPRAMKFCEDLVFAFIVAVSASNKANYSVVFDIPIDPITRNGERVSVLDADFGSLSNLLSRKFGVTRRQFARGLADRIRAYLAEPENVHVLDDVATKVGCDKQMAYLAFDGSTHCKGMNTREVQFTKTLESRNLFEREDEEARGASDRLLNSLTNGPRAVR
jgi:hypothetical protein